MPDERVATFTSSDPTLDKVWELVGHSALCTTQDQFVDTPTREKGQFLADAYNISQATMHHVFREQNLTWQALHDFADSQRRYWPNGNLNVVYPNGDGPPSFLDFTVEQAIPTGSGSTTWRPATATRSSSSIRLCGAWPDTSPA